MRQSIEDHLHQRLEDTKLSMQTCLDYHNKRADELLAERNAAVEKLEQARMIALWAAIDLDHNGHKAEGERVRSQLNGLDFPRTTNPKPGE